MRIIIFYICFGLFFIYTTAYAKDMLLTGNTYFGTKYVPPGFSIRNSTDIYDIDEQTYGLDKLLRICNSNRQPCEILAEVEIYPEDFASKGIITNIITMNGAPINLTKQAKNNNFINKYNECLKSSRELYDIAEQNIYLMEKFESILSKNDIDELRKYFGATFSIARNNPAELQAKERNISICDAYIELNKDFTELINTYSDTNVVKNNNVERKEIIDCKKLSPIRGSSYIAIGPITNELKIEKIVLDDNYVIPEFMSFKDNRNLYFDILSNKKPFYYDQRDVLNIQNVNYFDNIKLIDKHGNICKITEKDFINFR